MKYLSDCLFLFIWILYAPVESTSHGLRRHCDLSTPVCLRKLVQDVVPFFVNGIPERGISSLDPLTVENLNIVLSGGIAIDIHEGFTRGLRKCHVDSARNIDGTHYEVKLSCNLLIKGKYKSKGQLLMFAIDAEGDSTIKCKDLKMTATFELVPITKSDGKQYMKIQDFNSTHDFEGKVNFHLTNLFPGNPEMSEFVLKFLNENWRLVVEEFGGPFIEFGVKSVLNNVERIFDQIPALELAQMFIN
ncbi:circadian clock-controlled protein daywake [Bicyclus anynana]|uniref:Circadian clock-controlled protein daywake n=1 Tax=Bicyclus anynana TaxID=110368 RepID=A0A6J1NR29_BICAN|nr:circadian clock-controlled protein daywake [Bicyclus anynana]